MPGAGDVLTPQEIRAVVKFIRILSPGYELYGRFCAHCHGLDGVPPQAVSTTSQHAQSLKVPPRFDAAYFRTHTPAQVRAMILHMQREPRPAMPHLARQLNADETVSIVRYLRSLFAPAAQGGVSP